MVNILTNLENPTLSAILILTIAISPIGNAICPINEVDDAEILSSNYLK